MRLLRLAALKPGNLRRACIACVLLCASLPAIAHEVRPALLELTQQANGNVEVLWKVPMVETGVLAVQPTLPPNCVAKSPRHSTVLPGALVQRWRVQCDELSGELRIAGLERTLTTAFVRVAFADGRRIETVLTGADAHVSLATLEAPAAARYLGLGVEHILLGLDHLGFVVGLVLIVRGVRVLVWTLTAFTLAHSLTLAAAALGYIGLPARPVEVLIAFSIAVVAREAWLLARATADTGPLVESITRRAPWLIAFGFGLLHGFGFAGALAEIGLPENARVWALVLFNVGVELGQLLVIALIVPLLWWLRTRLPTWRLRIETTISGALGSVAMYWLLQRLIA